MERYSNNYFYRLHTPHVRDKIIKHKSIQNSFMYCHTEAYQSTDPDDLGNELAF